MMSPDKISRIVVGGEELLIGSAGSRSHCLLIAHRDKHKSSSLTSWANLKEESPEDQVLTELIYARILRHESID